MVILEIEHTTPDGDKRTLHRRTEDHYWVLLHDDGSVNRVLNKYEDAFICSALKAGFEAGRKANAS